MPACIGIGAGLWARDPSLVEPTRSFFNNPVSVKWLADMVKAGLGIGALAATYVGVQEKASVSLVQLMWGAGFVWLHHWLTLRAHALEQAAKAEEAKAKTPQGATPKQPERSKRTA